MTLVRKRWLAAVGAAIALTVSAGSAAPASAAAAAVGTGTVAGHLTDAGAPVASVAVYLYDQDYLTVATGQTDGAGAFSLADVPAGDYRLAFELPGQVTQFAYQQSSFDQASVISVADGVTTTVDETVLPHGAITGHVTNSDGSDLPYPYVFAHQLTTGVTVQTTGNADGTYSLPYVPAGTYRVSFRSQGGHNPQQYAHGKTSPEAADPIVVAAGASLTLDEVMLPVGAIAGHLTDNGQPVIGANVMVSDDAQGLSGTAWTDDSGAYRIAVFPGNYSIQYALPNGLNQWARQKTDSYDADLIAVPAGADTIVDEQLLPTGTVAGHLTDTAGNPVAWASVTASDYAGHQYFGQTDEAGTYQMTVFPGSYRLSFGSATGTQWAHAKTTAAAADLIAVTAGGTSTVDETMLPTGSVAITARDSITGAPITDFCASLDGVGDFPCANGGTATFAQVQPGSYQASVYPNIDGYLVSRAAAQVVVTSGQTATVVVDVVPAATLTTTVVDASTGAPVANVCLDLVPPTQPTVLGTGGAGYCSDSTGALQVPRRTPGQYNLFAWANDGAHGHQWVGRDGGVGAQRKARLVTLGAGQTVTLPPIRMHAKGSISGVITDAATGTPIGNARAGFSTINAGFGGTRAVVVADAQGRYTIDDLGPYEWTLNFQHHGYATEFSGNAPSPQQASGVKVRAGATTGYDVRLGKGLTLTGLVTTADGQPARFARVTVVQAASGDEIGVDDIDRTGRYAIAVLGEQRIKLTIEGHAGWEWASVWYISASSFETATTIKIPDSTGTKTLNLTIAAPTAA